MSGVADESETTAEAVVKWWNVSLSGTVYTTVEVEAATQDEAEREALSQVNFMHTWVWDDDVSGIMVDEIAEVEA